MMLLTRLKLCVAIFGFSAGSYVEGAGTMPATAAASETVRSYASLP